MATAITTATKTASVVKNTRGSEKKWSEILSMNRREGLQLPVNIEKYNTEFKRTYNCHQRQQRQIERMWANKHETWYKNDFLFRNHLLKQLKPITRRFKHINSLSTEDQLEENGILNDEENGILNDEEMEFLSLKKPSNKELAPIKRIKKCSHHQYTQNFNSNDQSQRQKAVFSKLACPKVLHEYEPRLYSHHHAPFLDVAQRFLKHKPEFIEKNGDFNEKQRQQKQYLKMLIDNEQERARLATIRFGQQLENEKNYLNDFDDDDDENYY